MTARMGSMGNDHSDKRRDQTSCQTLRWPSAGHSRHELKRLLLGFAALDYGVMSQVILAETDFTGHTSRGSTGIGFLLRGDLAHGP